MGLELADLTTITGGTVVITILVQLLKTNVPRRWIAHLAVVLGLVLAIVASLVLGKTSAEDLGNAALAGFLAGASSVGLYQLQRPAAFLTSKNSTARHHESQPPWRG